MQWWSMRLVWAAALTCALSGQIRSPELVAAPTPLVSASKTVAHELGIDEAGNVSEVFARTYEASQPALSATELARLREDYTIVLLPGFFSDFTLTWTSVGYFARALDYLTQLGLTAERDFLRVVIKSQRPRDENRALIYAAITAAPKKVILIGHSKGATDAFYALAAAPQLWPKVGGLITIQAPFFGSPLVDYISGYTPYNWGMQALISLTGGSAQSFREFAPIAPASTEARQLASTAQELPFRLLNFVSYVDATEKMSIPLLRPLQTAIAQRERWNDGLLPTRSGILPGTPYIIYGGLDHTDTVVTWGERGKRGRFIGALLHVFLSLPAR